MIQFNNLTRIKLLTYLLLICWFVTVDQRIYDFLVLLSWIKAYHIIFIIHIYKYEVLTHICHSDIQPNMVSESCPKLRHVRQILKCRIKYCEPGMHSQKVTKASNKGCSLFEDSKKKKKKKKESSLD